MSERTDFEQFFQRYLMDHARRGTRILHFLGTSIAICGLLLGVATLNPVLILAGIAIGYFLSWCGHLFIERNMPSLLQHPVWSFQSDVRMFRLWLTGRLDAQYARLDAEGQVVTSPARPAGPDSRGREIATALERG